MACRNPSAAHDFARLDEPPAGDGEQAQTSREELKSLFRELIRLVDSLRTAEVAHDAESGAASRVREARQALEMSLATHGLRVPATVASLGPTPRESIRSTKRFIASSGTSLKATLMFGKH